MRKLRVRVYRNLNKDCFSICDKKTGRVIAHEQSVMLTDVKFVVRQAGWQRCVKEKRKNVHAWVEGNLVIDPEEIGRVRPGLVDCVEYNPYISHYFHYLYGGVIITESDAALCEGKYVYTG